MEVNQLPILSNVQVSARYWHMVVSAPGLVNRIQPGQFFNILCETTFPFLRRPFSIYRINKEEETIEFLYLVQGDGTKKMTEFKAGEKVDVFGPLGVGFTLEKDWETVLLLARGVGIATLAALAQEASNQNKKCIAILSARSHNDLLATETLQGLGAEVYKVTEEDGNSGVEYVEQLIENILAEQRVDAGFTCGSKRLSKLLQAVTRKYIIPSQIALEEHMACGMGACFACVCDIRSENATQSVRVCTEGPVFDLDKVVMA
ncbi:dihydroorotate dehydrogenase electron transfer subunit [Sporosarcina sp. 179-K 8C2 HS]|uniref:dihydroorotate dehydrogenase electron transfer subunit n=1 Tax=Sporosarcina sp. 179-K 8C2 HS TaxID=3142387 RepID=UPI0039A19E6E